MNSLEVSAISDCAKPALSHQFRPSPIGSKSEGARSTEARLASRPGLSASAAVVHDIRDLQQVSVVDVTDDARLQTRLSCAALQDTKPQQQKQKKWASFTSRYCSTLSEWHSIRTDRRIVPSPPLPDACRHPHCTLPVPACMTGLVCEP